MQAPGPGWQTKASPSIHHPLPSRTPINLINSTVLTTGSHAALCFLVGLSSGTASGLYSQDSWSTMHPLNPTPARSSGKGWRAAQNHAWALAQSAGEEQQAGPPEPWSPLKIPLSCGFSGEVLVDVQEASQGPRVACAASLHPLSACYPLWSPDLLPCSFRAPQPNYLWGFWPGSLVLAHVHCLGGWSHDLELLGEWHPQC